MLKNKKILLSIKSLQVSGGGAERVFVDVANYLVNIGWSVEVITLDFQKKSFYPLDDRVVFHALNLNDPGTPTSIGSLIKFIVKNRLLANIIKPNLYISFMHSLYVPAQLSMLCSNVPFVASEHFRASYESSPFQNMLVRFVSRFHRVKTVPSQSVFNDLDPVQRKKTVILPNPVDDRFFTGYVKPQHEKGPLRILCIGRLMREKNHIELFEAIHLVREAFSGWSVELFGDGVDRAFLESYVKKLGLQSIVSFKGFSSALEQEYSHAEFTVIPSLYESFGLAAAESLAAGCPVLAFECCHGVGELVQNELNGLLIPANNDRVEALANGLKRMICDPVLRSTLARAATGSVQNLRRDVVLQSWEKQLLNIVSDVSCR